MITTQMMLSDSVAHKKRLKISINKIDKKQHKLGIISIGD